MVAKGDLSPAERAAAAVVSWVVIGLVVVGCLYFFRVGLGWLVS